MDEERGGGRKGGKEMKASSSPFLPKKAAADGEEKGPGGSFC